MSGITHAITHKDKTNVAVVKKYLFLGGKNDCSQIIGEKCEFFNVKERWQNILNFESVFDAVNMSFEKS